MIAKTMKSILLMFLIVGTSISYSSAADDEDNDTLVIQGAMQIASVPYSPFGITWDNAVQLAILNFTEGTGEFMGHPVEIMSIDEGCNFEDPNAITEPLTQGLNIVGVVGPTCSGATLPVLPDLYAARLLTISPSTTFSALTDPANYVNWPNFFRTAANDKLQGKVAAKFVRNVLGAQTAATVYHPKFSESEDMEQAFVDEFTSQGGIVQQMHRFRHKFFKVNVLDIINILQAQPVDALFLATNPFYSGIIIPKLRAVDPSGTIKVVGRDSLVDATDIFEILGPNPAELYAIQPRLDGSDLSAVTARYENMFGTAPGLFELAAYDATMLVLRAMEGASQVDAQGNLVISRQGMIDYMNSPSSYPVFGAASDYPRDENGQLVSVPVNGELNPAGFTTYKAQDGEFKPLP